MRFALLGTDADAEALVREIVQDPAHRLELALEVGDAEAAIRALAPGASFAGHWEDLLSTARVDAVIVGREGAFPDAAEQGGALGVDFQDMRADQLRKLIQAAMPLVVSHPIHDSMLIAIELDMIRQDARGAVQPNMAERWHPAVLQMAAWIAAEEEAPLGRCEQVLLERTLTDRSRGSVLRHFARDVDLLRELAGPLTNVGAMNAATQLSNESLQAAFANLNVQMSGPSGILARWSVLPAAAAGTTRLTLVGTEGRALLEMHADRPWTLTTDWQEEPSQLEFADWQPAAMVLEQFMTAVEGGESSPSWTDAAQAMELADAVERSLRRGRTIELHFEEHTEQGSFKGVMAAAGCLLLMLGLAVTVIGAVIGGFNFRIADYWPHILLGTLVIFLLLQSLRLVYPDVGRNRLAGEDQPMAP